MAAVGGALLMERLADERQDAVSATRSCSRDADAGAGLSAIAIAGRRPRTLSATEGPKTCMGTEIAGSESPSPPARRVRVIAICMTDI